MSKHFQNATPHDEHERRCTRMAMLLIRPIEEEKSHRNATKIPINRDFYCTTASADFEIISAHIAKLCRKNSFGAPKVNRFFDSLLAPWRNYCCRWIKNYGWIMNGRATKKKKMKKSHWTINREAFPSGRSKYMINGRRRRGTNVNEILI